jgi:hypothetical protein
LKREGNIGWYRKHRIKEFVGNEKDGLAVKCWS